MRLANIIAGLCAAGVLAALLVIGVRRARYAAREMQSSNNLKQLALAAINYESAHRCLPPGCDHNDSHGWTVHIHNFLEASSLYNRVRKDIAWNDRFNAYHFRQILSVYQNPNVPPKWTQSGFALSHYTANRNLIHRGSQTKIPVEKSSGAIWCFSELANDYRPWGSPYNWQTLADIVKPVSVSEDRFVAADYLQAAMLDGSIRRIAIGASPTELSIFGHRPENALTLAQSRRPPNLASYSLDCFVSRAGIDLDDPHENPGSKLDYGNEIVRLENEVTAELGPPNTVMPAIQVQRLAHMHPDIDTLILRYELTDAAALQLTDFSALRNLLVDSSSLTAAGYAALKAHPTLVVTQGVSDQQDAPSIATE